MLITKLTKQKIKTRSMVTRISIAKILCKCKTKLQVEALFKKYKIYSTREKIKILNKCMGNPMTFYPCENDLDLEKKYRLELQIFLLGEWRVIKLYERLKF